MFVFALTAHVVY